MGRELTRYEVLVEASAAATKLREFGSRGDWRRFTDDEVFRYAVAFEWLRLTEPLCGLISRRLIGTAAPREWEPACEVRNLLAHERDQDINYTRLWEGIHTTLGATEVRLDQLIAESES